MTDTAIALSDDGAIAARIDAFVRGEQQLTGLDLYLELERSSPLVTFHTMLRQGPQNRAASGLQQSYGDHNRLLMLAIDKMLEADLEWYRSRLDGAGDVSDDELQACFDAVAGLHASAETLVALWLAAAMHDCGMLCGRGSYVDVEDGIVLSREVIDTLCPPEQRPLAYFALHNHDFVKDVFLGEAPAAFVADELDALDGALQRAAAAALGIIQVAGAASLGEGRLGSFRMEIFRDCFEARTLADRSTVSRLSRLLEPRSHTAAPSPDAALHALEALDGDARSNVDELLDRAALHGWHRLVRDDDATSRIRLLVELAEIWHRDRAHHLVLQEASGSARDRHRADICTSSEIALNGSRVTVVTI